MKRQLEYSIYVSTIAVTLLNFGAKPTPTSFVAAAAFTVLAVLSLCYSVGTYLYRSEAIRKRKAGARFYDRWDPTALCGALLVALILNFVFEGKQRGML